MVSSIYERWKSMVLHHHGHNLHINIWNLDWPNNVQLALGGMVRLVLRNDRGGLVSWNADTQMIKDIEIDGFYCTPVGSYVESLVLLDKASNSVASYISIENGKSVRLISCLLWFFIRIDILSRLWSLSIILRW